MSEWISVDERNPEMHQRVMVATVDCDDNPIVVICTFNHGKRYLALGGRHDKDVTHWMPLPEPPNKS